MSVLANRLKMLREDKELMQKELASFLQITTSAYGFYEQGKRIPTPEVLSKLADYFGVTIDYLVGRSDIRTSQSAEKEKTMSKEIETIAAHLDDKELTPHKVKMIKRYIDDLFDEEF